MRFIVLNAFKPNRFAVWIDIHFHLREIEVEGAVNEASATQGCGELPGKMQLTAEFAVRFRLQDCVGFLVSKPLRAADYALCKARALCSAALVELDENGKRQAIDARI